MARNSPWALHLGLQARLLLAFLVVAILPLLALYLVQQQQLEHQVNAYAESRMSQLATVQQRRVAREFRRLADQLDLIASRTQMRLSIREHLDTADPAALALLERILRDAMASAPNIRGIWISRPDGAPLTAVQAIASEAPAPDAPRLDLWLRDDGQVFVWLSTELRIGEQDLGSLHLLSDTSDIGSILVDYNDAQQGGRTLLVTELGGKGRTVLAAGEADGASLHAVRHEQAPGVAAAIGQVAGRGGDDGLVQDAGHLYAVELMPGELGWVVVTTDRETLRQIGQGQVRALGLNLSVLVLLALVVAFFMAARIARPLRHLSEATRRLRDGDDTVRIPESGWGEFAQLARSFNRTAEELSRQSRALEAEVDRSRAAQRELADMAGTDHLTGLMNRRRFMEVLSGHLDTGSPEERQGALLYIDLDRFKPVNDQYGHDAGDETLRVVAERLRGLVRGGDAVARLGGDEFAVLIRERLPDGELDALSGRITHALSQPVSVRGCRVQVGCSVGFASIGPDTGQEELLSLADREMYRVKLARRNTEHTSG